MINITGLFPADKCISYYQLSPDLKSLIDEDRFKNEMAFLDPSDGVLYGPIGIKKAIGSNTGFFNAVINIPFIFSVFIFIYKIIAYNRYVILLPEQAALECDCGPDKDRKYRNYYFFILAVLNLGVLAAALKIAGLEGEWFWLNLLVFPLLYIMTLGSYKILYPNTYHFDLRQHSITSLFYAFTTGMLIQWPISLLIKQYDLIPLFLSVSGIVFFTLYRSRINFLQLKLTFVYVALFFMFLIPFFLLLF
ncbi:hypothetical protein MYP_4285 [Sporocytophaga myxococcoides]|uniref:Uncharacterized protein n=1 Tax=Sporocytophaga myxococcoides TaxID=153721 RepID=A0A098LJC5_9BACT|nr:hypothetical protein [Sporocytophaga myxococcoides]GAL87055.1 hypothetical protein MYP_4285 [Sporocytophaga myxococcoides]